jgi:phage shock protein C
MNEQRDGGGAPRGGAPRSREFHEAVDRFEQAVQELVGSATGNLAERAAALIDQTTDRLRREFGAESKSPGAAGGAAGVSSHPAQGATSAHARRPRHGLNPAARPRSRRLYRDPEHRKIVGVCAGIANYYGIEPWVVRIIAVTGLLFLPSIVFPAYWIGYFLMDKPPAYRQGRDSGRDPRRHDSSPAPELGPQLSPRQSLRNVVADMTEVELRLRRIETHVTSGHYELQRELNKIDEAPR